MKDKKIGFIGFYDIKENLLSAMKDLSPKGKKLSRNKLTPKKKEGE